MQQVKRDEPEAIKQLKKIYESLNDATCITDAMTLKICEAIEEAFVTTIAETSAMNYLGNMSDITWVMAYKEYVSTITRMIEDIVSGMRADGSINNIPEDVSITLTTCHLKIKVIVAHLVDKYHNFPFFCPSFLVSLCDHYSKISCAILEVHPSVFLVHFHAEVQDSVSAQYMCPQLTISYTVLCMVDTVHLLYQTLPKGLEPLISKCRHDPCHSCTSIV